MAHVVKSHIGQFQTQSILPVQSTAHRIGSLTIGQILPELEDGDQRQAPRSIGWLSAIWKQIGKQLILVDGS
jgi:hypothetical protein